MIPISVFWDFITLSVFGSQTAYISQIQRCPTPVPGSLAFVHMMYPPSVPGRKPSHQSLRRRRKTPCFLDVSFSLYVLIYVTFKLCRRPLLKVMKRWQSILWQTKCLVAIRKTWRFFRWKRSFVFQRLSWKFHCPFHSWCWPIWFVGLGIATQAGCVSALCDVEVGSSTNERSHRDHGSSRENVRLMSPMRMWSHAPGGTHVQWKRAAIASCDHFFKACNGLGPWAAGDHEDACHCVYEQKAPLSAQKLMQISARKVLVAESFSSSLVEDAASTGGPTHWQPQGFAHWRCLHSVYDGISLNSSKKCIYEHIYIYIYIWIYYIIYTCVHM